MRTLPTVPPASNAKAAEPAGEESPASNSNSNSNTTEQPTSSPTETATDTFLSPVNKKSNRLTDRISAYENLKTPKGGTGEARKKKVAGGGSSSVSSESDHSMGSFGSLGDHSGSSLPSTPQKAATATSTATGTMTDTTMLMTPASQRKSAVDAPALASGSHHTPTRASMSSGFGKRINAFEKKKDTVNQGCLSSISYHGETSTNITDPSSSSERKSRTGAPLLSSSYHGGRSSCTATTTKRVGTVGPPITPNREDSISAPTLPLSERLEKEEEPSNNHATTTVSHPNKSRFSISASAQSIAAGRPPPTPRTAAVIENTIPKFHDRLKGFSGAGPSLFASPNPTLKQKSKLQLEEFRENRRGSVEVIVTEFNIRSTRKQQKQILKLQSRQRFRHKSVMRKTRKPLEDNSENNIGTRIKASTHKKQATTAAEGSIEELHPQDNVWENVCAKRLISDRDHPFVAPVFQKTNLQREKLMTALKKNFLLADLLRHKPETDAFVESFEPISAKAGEVILKEGEVYDVRDHYYFVVEQGTVEFQVDGKVIGTAEQGASFGHMNLLYNASQRTTVVAASEPTVLMRVAQGTFRGIMQQATIQNKEGNETQTAVSESTTTSSEPLSQQDKDGSASVTPPISNDNADKGPTEHAPTTVVTKAENEIISSSLMNRRASIRASVQSNIRLEDLEKISILGEGQFGEVWLVAANVWGTTGSEDPRSKKKFALKSQFKFDGIREDAAEMIQREMDIMKQLYHPFVADLVHTYEDETSMYMLMGLVRGGELWDIIHQECDDGTWKNGIPVEHAKFCSILIADTLAYMHGQQIVYRDLKPENVMIERDGYPVIVDFGFAKHCPNLTYTFCGTPNYVSPEIIKNSGHNAGADYWALGVLVYEMVVGENPFYYEGMDQMSLFQTICEEKYCSFGKDIEGITDDLLAFVEGLLEKDPNGRLGMLSGKSQDVVQHKWFDGMDLIKLRNREIPAPWIPPRDEQDAAEIEAEDAFYAAIAAAEAAEAKDKEVLELQRKEAAEKELEEEKEAVAQLAKEEKVFPKPASTTTIGRKASLGLGSTSEHEPVEFKLPELKMDDDPNVIRSLNVRAWSGNEKGASIRQTREKRRDSKDRRSQIKGTLFSALDGMDE